MKSSKYLLLLIFIIFITTCKKEDPHYLSSEDFIHYMLGDWKVDVCYGPTIWLDYKWPSEEIRFNYRNYSQEDETYSIYDSIICYLPQIEYMQDWTITNNDKELFLETRSLCGDTNNFKMEYNNLVYVGSDNFALGYQTSERAIADINLINEDSILYLDDFNCFLESTDIIDFRVMINDSSYWFRLREQ